MRIGLLADIHANLPALDSVLADMPPVDIHVCVGDIIGYNPWPAECVSRIQNLCSVVVQGNHDRTVRTPNRYRHNRMAEAGLSLALEQLSETQLAWLESLSRTATISESYLMVHSHPDESKRGEYVYPDDFPKIPDYVESYRGCILGHTHVQHATKIDDCLIVNPGSVGQPRDGDNRAAYAILDTSTDTIELCRVEYDIERVQEKIRETGLPERTATRLSD